MAIIAGNGPRQTCSHTLFLWSLKEGKVKANNRAQTPVQLIEYRLQANWIACHLTRHPKRQPREGKVLPLLRLFFPAKSATFTSPVAGHCGVRPSASATLSIIDSSFRGIDLEGEKVEEEERERESERECFASPVSSNLPYHISYANTDTCGPEIGFLHIICIHLACHVTGHI